MTKAIEYFESHYDVSENVIKQFMDDGLKFRFTIGDITLTYDTYDDFLKNWDDDTGIPCWTCGHELFRFRGTTYLRCFGLGKWMGKV